MRNTTKIIDNSLQTIIAGLNTAANIIISTMGGAGKNVIISKPDDNTREPTLNFTKDGVSVARNIILPDPIQDIGAALLINAANKTVEQCGDGTTSTVLFIKTLLNDEYLNTIEDRNEFLDELDVFLERIEKILREQSKQVESIDDVYRIAMTSCKSPKVANLIKEIYIKTGFGANISLEMSRTSDRTDYELTEGLSFETGMVNTRFANQTNNLCVLENVNIIVENEPINSIQPYNNILNACLKEDAALLIIAPQFSEAFIRHTITNKIQGGLKICLVQTPGYGTYQKENIKDINAFSTSNQVDKIIVSQSNIILFNHPETEKINKRVNQLNKLADNAVEDYDEEDYRNRIVRLCQTGAIIYVGGVTTKNAKEEYDRIEDALGATSAAIKYGYVRGAGIELVQIIPLFSDLKIYPLIERLLSKPFNQILDNANITRAIKTDVPFNVKTQCYDENIIDPTDVVLNSLKNAVSLFKLLINTSYIVHNE